LDFISASSIRIVVETLQQGRARNKKAPADGRGFHLGRTNAD
jgi:hypothetical protein